MVKMKLSKQPDPMKVISAQVHFMIYTEARKQGDYIGMEVALARIYDLGFEVKDQPNGGWALVSRKETE